MADDVRQPGQLPEWAEKLRGIQSIIDRALSALDPQALLDALVERVRDALQADTAAVLLLDHTSGQLVATAAAGLEEEIQQGVRIKIGRGFAGQIAALRRPVILDEVDQTTVVNPILLSKGIRSLMGAPLMTDGMVVGVLHVGTLQPRSFTAQDVDLLQLAADRAALAVQALAAQLDRAAASALQRSLLPTGLPSVAGISMATRYVPGTGNVGGDWYDVFVLPSGELCAVIGDVAGSGLRAAAIMGRIRSALRAYAIETSDPADILSRLEGKLQYFEPDAMVTVLCAVFSPALDKVRVSSAGHLPPILACPGFPAGPVDVLPDLLIGMPDVRPRRNTILDLPPGATLCMYTDGLVERRDRSIDEGIRRLIRRRHRRRSGNRLRGGDDCHGRLQPAQRRRRPAYDPPGSAARCRRCRVTSPDGMVRWSGRHAVVTMPDEIDVTNSARVVSLLAGVAAERPDIITADMTGTNFCDSSGIHALARGHRLTAANGGELRLAVGASPAARVLQLTGLDQVLPVFADVQQSLDTPGTRRPAPGLILARLSCLGACCRIGGVGSVAHDGRLEGLEAVVTELTIV